MSGENAAGEQVAVDGHGDSIAVWDYGPDGSLNHLVQAAVRPAGGNWQTVPTNLATCLIFPATPQVAVDTRGDAVAVWACGAQGSADRVIDVATRPPGGSWSQPVTISNAADINVEDPEVAVDPDGDAVVTWVVLVSATSFVESAERPAGGTWSKPIDVSRTDDSVSEAPVAMDPGGDATAVWTIDNGVNLVAEASMRPKGATGWSAPVDISSAAAAASNASVAVTPQGTAVAVWQHGSNTSSTIEAALHPAGGEWHAPLDISAGGKLAERPELAIDSKGDTTAVWDRSNGTDTIVQAAQLSAGAATWQAPANLSATGQNATAPAVAADPAGDLVAVWERSNGTNTVVQAASRPADDGWQAPQNLSVAGQNAENPQVAVDPRGNATTVWDRSNGTNTVAQAVGYDAGPLLSTVTIPTSGTVGKRVAFSAAPAGVWSAVTATKWTFGDGQSATGSAVAHAYTAAGTYTVKLTSTDANGGSTSESRTITIAAGPKPPPTGAPTLTAVSQAHKKWRDGPKRGHRPPPSGTSFSFTVDQPATVTLKFTETTHGRKVKSKCQAQTKLDRTHPSCKRFLVRGTLTKATTAGRHTIHFAGRVSGHKLPAGPYSVRITAANSSGKRSRPVTLHFTIVE